MNGFVDDSAVDPALWTRAASMLLDPYCGMIIAAVALVAWIAFCRLALAKKVAA